jgi:hypothetical protein
MHENARVRLCRAQRRRQRLLAHLRGFAGGHPHSPTASYRARALVVSQFRTTRKKRRAGWTVARDSGRARDVPLRPVAARCVMVLRAGRPTWPVDAATAGGRK